MTLMIIKKNRKKYEKKRRNDLCDNCGDEKKCI